MAVTVLTSDTSLVRGTTAKFNGELTDINGQTAIDCYFQYKITGAADWQTTTPQGVISEAVDTPGSDTEGSEDWIIGMSGDTHTREPDHLYISNDLNRTETSWITRQKVNLTNVITLAVDWESSGYSNSNNETRLRIRNADNVIVHTTLFTNVFSRRLDLVDVSGLNGDHFIELSKRKDTSLGDVCFGLFYGVFLAMGRFAQEVTGLTENESYDVRAVAEWDDGGVQNAYGDTETFNALWVREGLQEDFERGILDGVRQVTHQVLAVFKTTGSHSWTVPAGISEIDVLVVAGGGGGGSRQGGGGGAGGLVFEENFSVTPEADINVTVGSGGNGGTSGGQGTNGGNSIFGVLEAIGGGAGSGRSSGSTGNNGGSGGGGADTAEGGSGTAGPPRQGYDGGDGGLSENSGGGGGGADEPGDDGHNFAARKAGDGGDGLDFSAIFGTEVGDDGWFAGGGGGGSWSVSTNDAGFGGRGGGGDGKSRGSATSAGDPGTANTGGGGGGAVADTDNGGSGGSGIVIIAVPLDNVSLGGEGTRQKPYKITNTESEITWTATTPTDTSVAIEAQVQGTTAITDEAVGTGDGTTKIFTLDHWPANTPTITVNAVAETGFTLGNDRRMITFDTAPADTHAILASYTAVDDPVGGVEIQELDLDNPAGGTFKLGDGTGWTSDIAYDATAATIQTALEGLYGAGNVGVAPVLDVGGRLISHNHTLQTTSASSFIHDYENPEAGDLILITCHGRANGAVTSIDYGGVTPVLIDKNDDDWPETFVYAIAAANQPAKGQTHTLTVNWSDSSTGATSFTKIKGVKQSTLDDLSNIVSKNKYVESISVSETVTATGERNFVFDAVTAREGDAGFSPLAGQEELFYDQFDSPRGAGSSYKLVNAGDVTMRWENGYDFNRIRYVIAAIELNTKYTITFDPSVGNSGLVADFTGLT